MTKIIPFPTFRDSKHALRSGDSDVFSPEDVANLGLAYERACEALGLLDPDDPRSEIVAQTIMLTAQRGVRDPGRLQDIAVSRVRL